MRRIGGEEFRASIRVILFFLKRHVQAWTHFRVNMLMDIADLLLSLAVYLIMAFVAGAGLSGRLTAYGGDYLSFIVVGLLFNKILRIADDAPWSVLSNAFWSRKLEALMASPVNIGLILLGESVGMYFLQFVSLAVYMLIGMLLVSYNVSLQGLLLSTLALSMGVISSIGIGLVAASTFYLLQAKSDNPISWFLELLTGLASGLYFPVNLLPWWGQLLASLLPHTYVLDTARRLLLGGETEALTLPLHRVVGLNPIIINTLLLGLFAAVIMPLGWWLFGKGLRSARRDGRMAWWT